jgi:glutathione synthase/RimK-type ligase-like ATP-grasp enzyme
LAISKIFGKVYDHKSTPFTEISMHTRKLSKKQVLSHVGKIQNCPIILQEYVPKKYELRITVVGKKVFPCAIYSQENPKSIHDMRMGLTELGLLRHQEVELPSDVVIAIHKLMFKLNLSFGCIDMIVTPDNEYYFLEVNPNGQWLWIEKETGMKIGEAITEQLCVNLS